MRKKQRTLFEIVVALYVISLMTAFTPVAKAESASALSSNTALSASASTNFPAQGPIWLLGIALIGGAIIFRRDAP